MKRVSNYTEIASALYPGLLVVKSLKEGDLLVDISKYAPNLGTIKVTLADYHLMVDFTYRPLGIECSQELTQFLERTDLNLFTTDGYFLNRELTKEELLKFF